MDGVCERESYRTMSKIEQSRQFTPVSNEALLTLLETLPSALFIIDDTGTIIYSNACAQLMIGATSETLLGDSLWRAAPRLVSVSLYQAVQKVRHTREPAMVRYVSPATGTWLQVSLSPIDEGLALFISEDTELPSPQNVPGQNEQMYRDLLESFADSVIILTPDGLILDINRRPLTDGNIRLEEVIGRPITNLPTWSSDPLAQRQMREAIVRASQGETVRFEARIRPRDGLDLDILMTVTSHRDANQQVEYLICAGRDITERKHHEDELRMLVDAIPHFVWTMRPDGSAEYANQRWCDYTNMAAEQLQGDGWVQCLHPEDRPHVLEVWETAVRARTPYEVEHRIRGGESGEYRWFLGRGVPLRDSQGKILRWFGTCTDIDERKRVEEALRQSQERVNILMNSSLMGIFVSAEEQVVEANDTYLRMTGYTREDLQAGIINWVGMTPPEYAEQTQQARQELTASQHVTRYDKEYVCKDGSRLPVVVGAVVVRLEPLQAIGFVLDNSARQELEQRKDDFINMAGHELKTPLTSLKLQTQLLRARLNRQGFHEIAADLAMLEKPVRQLERLIAELLDVSKIQAGRLEYLREPVDLEKLLHEVACSMQQMSPTHTIKVRGTVPRTLIGDQSRLEQVFTNLISNAVKYSPEADTVEIDLNASAGLATVQIHDHGIGIPREQREKIFERFYRAIAPRERSISGLGMGLYIVSEIVNRHGGTITVDSAVGEGSIFTVTLPLDCDI